MRESYSFLTSSIYLLNYTLQTLFLNEAARVIIVGIRKDIWEAKGDFDFPKASNAGSWAPLSVAVPELAIADKKYYFSEKAVQGMKNAKNNMKRGLAQNLDEPCLTVTSHLAKVSLNSRDPVLLVDPEKELYRRFTPLEAARIQSFPDNFKFAGTETTAYRQIGNAIPPVLFWHITNAIILAIINIALLQSFVSRFLRESVFAERPLSSCSKSSSLLFPVEILR